MALDWMYSIDAVDWEELSFFAARTTNPTTSGLRAQPAFSAAINARAASGLRSFAPLMK
jgi:hypothetical protein